MIASLWPIVNWKFSAFVTDWSSTERESLLYSAKLYYFVWLYDFLVSHVEYICECTELMNFDVLNEFFSILKPSVVKRWRFEKQFFLLRKLFFALRNQNSCRKIITKINWIRDDKRKWEHLNQRKWNDNEKLRK